LSARNQNRSIGEPRGSWLLFSRGAAVPVILYGALFLTAAGVEAYMVAFRGAQPGDLVFPDHPAVSSKESLIQVSIGAGIIAVGLFARMYRVVFFWPTPNKRVWTPPSRPDR
jgi:hypothetical protein